MNIETIHYFNLVFGIGAIFLQVASALVLGMLFLGPKENKFLDFLKKNYLILGFLVALVSTLSSLYYSEVIGFLPCMHCWIQRIFMYPQVFLFGVAWLKKEANVFWYSLPLLVVGFLDALYLNYLYYFGGFDAPCDASGVSCVKQYVSEFGGYISIPSLAITSFVALIVLLLVAHLYKKE